MRALRTTKSRLHTGDPSPDQILLGFYGQQTTPEGVMAPEGYKGLAAFHKYWGKKPLECLGFLIERLTLENQIVMDPFLGSGLLSRECLTRNRRFIGIDINPISIELSRHFCNPPRVEDYHKAFQIIESASRQRIEESYLLSDGRIGTHFLWDNKILREIWLAPARGRTRETRVPSSSDYDLFLRFANYSSRYIKPPSFYNNSRINTLASLSLEDLFTGRALRNIDIILTQFEAFSGNLRRALILTLTAAIGQMSNMVFAITGRGKTTGKISNKIEVGSWVIGYWRPQLHFEINVWNSFLRRAKKLENALRGLSSNSSSEAAEDPKTVLGYISDVSLTNGDALEVLERIPDQCISLVLTDPPHSDRIPYLELSELWNAVLNVRPIYDKEIVVSNALQRGLNSEVYKDRMTKVIRQIDRVLVNDGCMALIFNSREEGSWSFLNEIENTTLLRFLGRFQMPYSANSVVQDNRKGAMKSDYVLIYMKGCSFGGNARITANLRDLTGWSQSFPKGEP